MILKKKIRNLILMSWYWYVSRSDKNQELSFLNYGYVNGNGKLKLKDEDEGNRYSIQLYNHVATSANIRWDGLDALEVGCGRGGGSSYIAKYLKPESMTGVDLCDRAIRFCRNRYSAEGLSFSHGDALDLSFEDNSFDVVINVESSHHYADMDLFLREVRRVLKPGGYFLFADLRKKGLINSLKKQVNNSGLKITKEEMITPDVLKSLDLDNERKLDIINRLVPRFLHGVAKDFAAVKGTKSYEAIATGRKEYLHFVLQKGHIAYNP